jgi:hypothetical protein
VNLYSWKTDHHGECIHQGRYYQFKDTNIDWRGIRMWDQLSGEEHMYVLSNPKTLLDYKFPWHIKCDKKCPIVVSLV